MFCREAIEIRCVVTSVNGTKAAAWPRVRQTKRNTTMTIRFRKAIQAALLSGAVAFVTPVLAGGLFGGGGTSGGSIGVGGLGGAGSIGGPGTFNGTLPNTSGVTNTTD